MKPTQFKDFNLNNSILSALSQEGYTSPTEIQVAAIPLLLGGKDLLATAQTGTGKTAAFSLPILHMLKTRNPHCKNCNRALILTPTRELALLIDKSFRTYGRQLSLRTTVIVGGVSSKPQIKALKKYG